ncbi:MAG TPA: hypothetical protein VFD67_07195 [Gemmatimonadaceae bacterium]|nr:hypothetical protein [Gemmatimonadaceae bacterium]
MTVDQMLRHVNIALGAVLGQGSFTPMKMPMPGPVFRFFALNSPWPKGSPTHPEFCVGERYDFNAEKTRCLTLIDEVAKKPMESAWPESAPHRKRTVTLLLFADLRGSRQADDVPEDVAHFLVIEPGIARERRRTANDFGLARRIERRQPRNLLHRADLLAQRDAFGEERHELVINAFDLLPALPERVERGVA